MVKGMTFHHLGIACEDIDETSLHYLPLGYKKGDITIDPLQNIRICFLSHSSMPCLELLSPIDENSPVVNIIKKNGTIPYHICYRVSNLEETISYLKEQNYKVISKPKVANAIKGNRVAFLYNKSVGLIELVGE